MTGDGLPTMGEDYEQQLIESDFPMDNNQPPAHRLNPQTGNQEPVKFGNEPGDPVTTQPHVLRMQIEAHELDKKGMALSMFINTHPDFKLMDPDDQHLMQQQQYHMGAYYGILLERIRRAGGKLDPVEAAIIQRPLPSQHGESINVTLNPDEHA